MTRLIGGLIIGIFIQSGAAFAAEDLFSSVEAIRKAILEPKIFKGPAPIRQADAGFVIGIDWISKEPNGTFKQNYTRVCERRIRVDVFDFREQAFEYPIVVADQCELKLDSRDGTQTYTTTLDLGGFIYLSKNPDGRSMKNFSPWAYAHSMNGPKWPMNGFLMTPDLALKELAFNFGKQSEHFYQDQTINVTASFADRNQ